MIKLNTIQKRNNLNEIYAVDDISEGGANHKYLILRSEYTVDEEIKGALHNDGVLCYDESDVVGAIQFQNGPRKDTNSISGVLDSDLLEIVRDRLKAFQKTELATRENACAITHIEEALMWMNKRVEDRAERGVLGTMEK